MAGPSPASPRPELQSHIEVLPEGSETVGSRNPPANLRHGGGMGADTVK